MQRGSVGGSPVSHCGHSQRSASGWARAGPGLRLSPGLPQARLRWLHCAPITPPYPRWRHSSHGVSPPTLDGRRRCTKVGARGRAAANRGGRAPPPRLLPARGGAGPGWAGRGRARAGRARSRLPGRAPRGGAERRRAGQCACPLRRRLRAALGRHRAAAAAAAAALALRRAARRSGAGEGVSAEGSSGFPSFSGEGKQSGSRELQPDRKLCSAAHGVPVLGATAAALSQLSQSSSNFGFT